MPCYGSAAQAFTIGVMPIYQTSPPAKLNLFLEILAKRDDGFHELDTVMVAIDWRDELSLRPVPEPGIDLRVDWLPNRASVAEELGVTEEDRLLDVPTDERNLVHRALVLINEATGYPGGWEVDLGKRIPSGAGMGGASSDAAATLRLAAAAIAEIDASLADHCTQETLVRLAEQLGSDVPFFLNSDFGLARALGRGERLSFYPMPRPHHFVVVYPAVSLSTADVYRNCQISDPARSGDQVVDAFCDDANPSPPKILYNALQRPACGLSPHVGEALDYVSNTMTGQHLMTGSGSACFAWIADPNDVNERAQAAGSGTTQKVVKRTATTNGDLDASDLDASALDASADLIQDSRLPTLSDFRSSCVRSSGALIRAVTTCTAASEIHIA